MQQELGVSMDQLHQSQQQILMTPGVHVSGLLFKLQTGHLLFK